MQVLARRTKNNFVLIGDSGVGKTAIVEGIAQRIAASDVPDSLNARPVLLGCTRTPTTGRDRRRIIVGPQSSTLRTGVQTHRRPDAHRRRPSLVGCPAREYSACQEGIMPDTIPYGIITTPEELGRLVLQTGWRDA
ncbi:MAG: hypothetical protein HY905_25690 [Deltaproteobacteria bacterium]|nr:hypothetical protein [Deltaproteobacteria bacterium]